MKRSIIENRGSTAVKILEEAWNNKLRQEISGLPEVVIVLLATGNRGNKLGHFAYSTWRYRKNLNLHEIAISPDLFENPTRLLECLLHESAHALLFSADPNNKNHLSGCSRNSKYYHTKEFRNTCQDLGLYSEFHNTRYGFCDTGFINGIPIRYRKIFKFIKDSLPYGTGTKLPPNQIEGSELPPSGHIKLICKCKKRKIDKGFKNSEEFVHYRKIYTSKLVVTEGGIFCKFCNSEFLPKTF